MRIGNSRLVKEVNLNNVRKLMRNYEYITKPELAGLSGLSVVTINSFINELTDRKEIMASKIAPSTGGRPATRYQYNLNYRLSLILTIYEKDTIDQLSAKVINLKGEEIYHDVQDNNDMSIDLIFHMIDKVILKYSQIEVICIVIPGQILDGEIKVGSHDLLVGLRLGDIIEERYKKSVIFENDVNAAVSGYASRSNISTTSALVGLYFPQNTPPGAGIFLHGQIVKGKHGMAGEIKYLKDLHEWFNYSTIDELYEKIYQMMHVFVSTLAPEKILIFREDIQEKKFITGWNKYAQSKQLPVLPDIHLESYLNNDITRGMKKWTLDLLEEKLFRGK